MSGRPSPLQQEVEISVLVPTRGRPEQLCQFLDSLVRTIRNPSRVEILLVVDDDDDSYNDVATPNCLNIRWIHCPAGQSMGSISQIGLKTSQGRLLFALNDDVEAKTPGWDVSVLKILDSY